MTLVASFLAFAVVSAQPAPRDQAVKLAIETLAARHSVIASAIQVVNVTQVEWRDASLGCPEKDMMYTQALVPGFKVLLQLEGKQYEVHTGRGRAVMCGVPAIAPKTAPIGTVKLSLAAGEVARKQLAAQLGIKPDDLVVRLVRPWRAADGVCDPPDAKAVSGSSFLVELARDEQAHRYRVAGERAWACPKTQNPRNPQKAF